MACVVVFANPLTHSVMLLRVSSQEMEPLQEWHPLTGWQQHFNRRLGRYTVNVNIDFWFPRRAA